MIRQLGLSDFNDVKEISQIKKQDIYLADDMLYYFLTDEKIKVLGYFDNSVLITWVAIKFGTLHDINTWCIIHMFTRNLKEFFSFGPDFGQIIAKAFELAESHGYYQYIYLVNKKHQNAYYRMWKTNKYLPPSNRYSVEDVAVIPSGTKAAENWMNRLMGGIREYDCVIKMRTLKKEFRNDCIHPS